MFKRVLIAAAIAGAFAAPAMAEVSITGSMEMNFVVYDWDKGDTQQGLDRGLQIDFNGSDKLDMGGKLIWKVSQKLNTGDPSGRNNIENDYSELVNQNTWGGREAWVGFAGDWGSLKVGRQFFNSYLVLDWPYGQGGNWQLVERNWGPAGHEGKLTSLIFAPSSVNYQSPNFGGFSFGIQHSWDNWATTGVGKIGDSNVTDLSVAFGAGSFNLNAGYLFGNDIWAAGSEAEQWYIGATYGFDFGLNVRGLYNYQAIEYPGSSKVDSYDWIIGATYGWGKNYVKGSWHQFDGDNFGKAGDIISAEYGYSLSKNTVAYGRIQNRNEKAGDLTYYMVGVWTGF
ncbi:porin [Chitinilyticum litopenaei]|uniref:porin n=1 Tax=Chitinilyticum litopenaei TaxID=1121276 RepID=UPI00040FA3BB|nr:porin [Chitinilyticum litopenaei]